MRHLTKYAIAPDLVAQGATFLHPGACTRRSPVGNNPADARMPCAVPTLFRFLFTLAIIAGLGFAGLIALVTFVEPQQREMSEIITPEKLNR